MNEQNQADEDPIRRGLRELGTIGRDLGGRLRDASDDVKEAWQKLQPRIAKADEMASLKTEEMTNEVKHATSAVIDDLKAQLQKLRSKIDGA